MTAVGSLRHRVTLQVVATAGAFDWLAFDPVAFDDPDHQGGREQCWATHATVWARVEPVTGSERLEAEAIGAHLGYQVVTRYRADLSPSMRLAWTPYGGTSKTLEIHGVHPMDGRRAFLRLLCGEVA